MSEWELGMMAELEYYDELSDEYSSYRSGSRRRSQMRRTWSGFHRRQEDFTEVKRTCVYCRASELTK